jgi:branched-chain amino acid transport system substrate-binding protein
MAEETKPTIERNPLNVSRRAVMRGATSAVVAGAALGPEVIRDINNGAKAAGSSPIPIGSMLPLTGAVAADGIGGKQGLELAVDEINALGGILGHPLELHIVDSKNMSAEDVVAGANRLIDHDGVHAIICCYNIGPNNAEYEPIADAGIIYNHVNTLLQHQQTVMKDPKRYFGCFMFCPPEIWYGANLPLMLSVIRDGGKWKPTNNTIALAIGSSAYSIVIADEVKKQAPKYGFEIAFSEVVPTPTTEWGPVLDKMRAIKPAVIANTHYYSGDLANFQRQFVDKPINALVYLQYGAILQSFADIAKDAAKGVLTSTMIAVLQDERGNAFTKKIKDRYGPGANQDSASYTYGALWQYAISAAIAGGTGEPGNFDQNRKIAEVMKMFPFRSVCGSVSYHPQWQCAQPYPAYTKDPSIGMPSLTFQIKAADGTKDLIYPSPYVRGEFVIPSWFS